MNRTIVIAFSTLDGVIEDPDGQDGTLSGGWAFRHGPQVAADDPFKIGESRDPNAFESVLTFAPDGAATRIEMRAVFPTTELRDEAAGKYHAIEGGQQTLSNLAAYVTDLARKGAEG
jgi:uncharacterized protein YndB with AHSA1/START domain